MVLGHIAIGVTRAHNTLGEQRLVRRVGVHLCLEGKAGAPAIVGIVLGVLVAQPVAGVELHARGGGVVVKLAAGPHLLDVHRTAQITAVLIAIDAQAVIVAACLLDLRVVGLHAGSDGAQLAKVKRCSLDRSNLAGGDVLLVNGQVVGSVSNKKVLTVHAGVMAGKVKVRVVGHGYVGGAVALAAILNTETSGARHGKHGRKGAVAGETQLAILKRGGHAHGVVDLVEFNIPYALVQTMFKIAVQVVDAFVGWHMPANEGVNNLHSDLEHGLHKRVWDVELDEVHNAVRMTTSLEDGELGLPGNRTFTAVFTVTRTGRFRIEYGCESDRATYVSMTNHTYFNLAGHNAGMDCEHFFVANAAHYLPINEQNIPTGEIAPVEGTPFDFRELRPVAPGMEADDPQIKQARGYDHCLCIDGYQYGRNLRRAMHVEEMWTGRELDYYTTAPGVQLYTGNWLGDEHAKDDANYGWGAGFALEAEMYPDTPHQPLFPQGIVGPGHPYSNVTEYHFMRH